MKPLFLLKGALLAACFNLVASDDVLKFTADEGHLFVMESGDVYYSHEADISSKVKIGTSDLEIYEVDDFVTPEDEGRAYLATSHPIGTFFPCESKKSLPLSRGVYHVSMENGLDRLVWLDEKRSMIVAQNREEHTVISVFEDYSLLTDGFIYEGWNNLVGGEIVTIKDGSFDYGDDRYNRVGQLYEEREIRAHYTATGECDALDKGIKVAITKLDRDCPKMWFGEYKYEADSTQKRILLAGEEKKVFYLDPATLEMMASNIPFFNRKERQLVEVISHENGEIVFDDGTKAMTNFGLKQMLQSIDSSQVQGNLMITHTPVSEVEGTIHVLSTEKGAEYEIHMTYDLTGHPKLALTYNGKDDQGECSGTFGLVQPSNTSATGHFTYNSNGEVLEIKGECRLEGQLTIDLYVTHPAEGDTIKVSIKFHKDFMELFHPTSMIPGCKVYRSKYLVDSEIMNFIGTLDLYERCDE